MGSSTITIQQTNNEAILKFVSNQILINGGSFEFNNIDEAKNSPLAQQLFYLPFVKKIFITANFIAIQRYDIVQWEEVQEEVREQIEAYFKAGNIAINEIENLSKKEPVEVYAEATPNPSVMKFGTNKILTQVDIEYQNIEEASKSSPLAKSLFSFPFVNGVFISENYISITKFDIVEWSEVYAELRNFITKYLQQNKTIINELTKTEVVAKKDEVENISIPNLEGTEKEIVSILEEYIRPAVAADGGNIAFQAYDEESKVVSVILQGACSGCPSSTVTLKNGIETMLKEMLPNKINEVIAING